MGRQVRMVPKDWEHPKNESGYYIPLHAGPYSKRVAEWDEEKALWGQCKRRHFGTGKIIPLDADQIGQSFEEWNGERPEAKDYMPEWPVEQADHFCMYEDTTEGMPISPAFPAPEELARWLADNDASAFGSMTATYEQWLGMCKAGWAPSAAITDGVLRTGVAEVAGVKSENTATT